MIERIQLFIHLDFISFTQPVEAASAHQEFFTSSLSLRGINISYPKCPATNLKFSSSIFEEEEAFNALYVANTALISGSIFLWERVILLIPINIGYKKKFVKGNFDLDFKNFRTYIEG